MRTLLDYYFRFLRIALTAMLVILLIPVFLQIAAGLLPFFPAFVWTEEIARFAFVWVIMLGATIAVREKTHFNIDILPAMKPKWEQAIQIFLFVMMLLMGAVFLIGGWQYARFGLTQQSEIAGLPMLAIYIAWPFAGLSWILFIIEQMYDHFDQADMSTAKPSPTQTDN